MAQMSNLPARADVRKKVRVQPSTLCEPTDDRCVQPIERPFLPGISVRHSPSCDGDLCHLFACDGGNWRVTGEGTLDRSRWIEGWIITQLLTRGLVNCDEHPLGKRDGGWWADAFRPSEGGSIRGGRSTVFRSGSKLWALQWIHGGASNVNNLVLIAKSVAQEALQWLIGWGIASDIDVQAFYIARGPLMGRRDRTSPMGAVIQLHITVSGPSFESQVTLEGAQQPNSEWLWREYVKPHATERYGGRLYIEAQGPS